MTAHATTISIPEGMDFANLKLERDPVTGTIRFDWLPIEAICAASGLDIALFREQHEDNVSGLIVAWYAEHLRQGGHPDPVQEQLLSEVQAEDTYGLAAVQKGGQA